MQAKSQFFGLHSKKTPGRKRAPGVQYPDRGRTERDFATQCRQNLSFETGRSRRREVCLKQSMIEFREWTVKQKSLFRPIVGGQDVR